MSARRDGSFQQESFVSEAHHIDDDGVVAIVPARSKGFAFVEDGNGQAVGTYYDLDNGAVTALGSTASATTGTGNHGGTTGVDGNLTVAADSGNGELDIENRTGGRRTVRVTFIG